MKTEGTTQIRSFKLFSVYVNFVCWSDSFSSGFLNFFIRGNIRVDTPFVATLRQF